MGRAVLIAIRPKWCELIASGKKTVEVRKTRPKLEPQFKCYIYCTNPSFPHEDFLVFDAGKNKVKAFYGGGKIIGEFICDDIFKICLTDEGYDFDVPKMTCLKYEEMEAYLDRKNGYGWHISDLVIYDEPKKLNDFWKWTDGMKDIRPCENGRPCEYEIYDYSEDCQACAIDFDGENCPFLRITRPPQSWCYVEEEE